VRSIAALVILLLAGTAHAQLETDGPFGSRVRLELSNRARYERIDWFRTAPDSAIRNYDYGFFQNRLQIGARLLSDPLEIFVQYQNSLLTSLPKNAPGPGGNYFANTPEVNQEKGILRNAWAKWKNPFDASGLSLQAGRQLYREGLEAPSADPTTLWLQKNRIAERLLGPFDYTDVGRSFDGGILAYDDAATNVTTFYFVPTWGGFEINANRQLEVGVAGGSISAKALEKLPGLSARLFGLWYRDRRDLVPVDNRPLPVRQADDGDIEVFSFGANLTQVAALGPGKLDVLLWGVTQSGDWQSQDHEAWAYAFELGFQLHELWSKPWLRVGLNQSSGDPDPDDGEHESFFQVLPTARLYALYPFYNLMNNRDLFAQLVLQPAPTVTMTTTAHWLRVSQSDDLLYAGGGATSNSVFGFGGTATGGRNGIGTMVDLSLAWQPTKWLTLSGYYAHVFGCGMIDQAFLGNDSSYAFAEATLAW
jgi:hypothetical protein